jgi:hypothetical protein
MLKKYNDRTEMEVIGARLSGVSFRQIYLSYGLHPSSVYHILKRHGIVHKGKGRGRERTGGVGGSNWVRVIEGEDERQCSCCRRLFKPYAYDYQINRTVCFWCFTNSSDGKCAV